ncbi:hypothetical protein NP493_1562g00030 [Ridgeia piscesae]|uniref:Uncharacterized protein n=1 Tax=Ridgeia piscesae TaxID=27915 RepID=A0AAD9N966_RIDPI|nr:hypothetical protein NP493_1562g00030 [Ridgeia piscesae]
MNSHNQQGVRTGATGVDTQQTCGLDGNCGLSRKPLKIGIPLFEHNRIVDVSVSVWFKRGGGPGCWPMLSSRGNPRSGTIQIDSLDDTHLMVTVGHCSGMKYQETFLTDSQSSDWRHLVITVHDGRPGDREWVKVYLDGNKCSQCLQPPVYNGLNDNFKNNDCDNNWAFIVAGSRGYGNYRHQADACHAYRVLIDHGFPPARIILMMYDDIAQHNRGSNDNIFVYYTNHGGPAILGFPTGPSLTAVSLNNAILQMYNNNKYRRMVFYVDSCNSGSMFRIFLPSNLSVYATTSTAPTEESRAVHYSNHLAAYLGDEYSSIANHPVATFQAWTDCDDGERNYRFTRPTLNGPCYGSGLCRRILYARREISRINCYLSAVERFNQKCFSVNQRGSVTGEATGTYPCRAWSFGRGGVAFIAKLLQDLPRHKGHHNQFAMLKLQILVNMCEEGLSKSFILRSIDAVCPPNMDRSPFVDMAD